MNGFAAYNIAEWMTDGLTHHVGIAVHSARQRVGKVAVTTVLAVGFVGASVVAHIPSDLTVTNMAAYAIAEDVTPLPSLRLIIGSAQEYWDTATAGVKAWKHSDLIDDSDALPPSFV